MLYFQKFARIVIGVTGFDTSALYDAEKIKQIDMTQTNNIVAIASMCAVAIFSFIINIYHSSRVSKIFGHGAAFTIGLILLPGIFQLVLGFGESKYNKKQLKAWEK